jgi:hypothetical protein
MDCFTQFGPVRLFIPLLCHGAANLNQTGRGMQSSRRIKTLWSHHHDVVGVVDDDDYKATTNKTMMMYNATEKTTMTLM